MLDFAAEQLGCAAAELTLRNWSVLRGNVEHALEPMIAKHFGGAGFEFLGRGHYKVPYDIKAPLRSVNLFWIPCWVGAEVEVDRETGLVRVLHLVVGADAGRSVNAQACRGQIEGAALQAYGQSLFEELRYDGALPANATPLRYRVPMASDLPERFTSFTAEHAQGPGPFVLGIAAAIANAIEDAVGVRITEMPFTPERVLAALDEQERKHGRG